MFECPFRIFENTLRKLRNFPLRWAKDQKKFRGSEKNIWAFFVLTRSADYSAVSELLAKFSLPPKRPDLWLSFELLGSPIGPKLRPVQSKLDSPDFGFFTSKIGLD